MVEFLCGPPHDQERTGVQEHALIPRSWRRLCGPLLPAAELTYSHILSMRHFGALLVSFAVKRKD
jgi:hypothetical protein